MRLWWQEFCWAWRFYRTDHYGLGRCNCLRALWRSTPDLTTPRPTIPHLAEPLLQP